MNRRVAQGGDNPSMGTVIVLALIAMGITYGILVKKVKVK
jgi:hypothetical protein